MTSKHNRTPTQVPTKPSQNGRTTRGQFAKGNPGGPGNPHAKRVAWLREALLDAVTEDDLRAIARTLVKKAKGGDLAAIRELLNRVIGKSPEDAEAAPPELIVVTGVPEPENDWQGVGRGQQPGSSRPSWGSTGSGTPA